VKRGHTVTVGRSGNQQGNDVREKLLEAVGNNATQTMYILLAARTGFLRVMSDADNGLPSALAVIEDMKENGCTPSAMVAQCNRMILALNNLMAERAGETVQ